MVLSLNTKQRGNSMREEIYKGFEPLPTDLQGWQGTSRIFSKLIDEFKPKKIIEVGSWKGQSTVTMAKACKKLKLDTEIFCVDTWLGAEEFYTEPTPERDLMCRFGYPQVYYQFLSNIINEEVVDMVNPITLPSNIAYSIVPNGVDMVYIDASHSYEDVKSDLRNYFPKVRVGGVIFGDDYTNGAFPGVRKAVDSYVMENKLKLEVHANWFWVIRK